MLFLTLSEHQTLLSKLNKLLVFIILHDFCQMLLWELLKCIAIKQWTWWLTCRICSIFILKILIVRWSLIPQWRYINLLLWLLKSLVVCILMMPTSIFFNGNLLFFFIFRVVRTLKIINWFNQSQVVIFWFLF